MRFFQIVFLVDTTIILPFEMNKKTFETRENKKKRNIKERATIVSCNLKFGNKQRTWFRVLFYDISVFWHLVVKYIYKILKFHSFNLLQKIFLTIFILHIEILQSSFSNYPETFMNSSCQIDNKLSIHIQNLNLKMKIIMMLVKLRIILNLLEIKYLWNQIQIKLKIHKIHCKSKAHLTLMYLLNK